MVAIATGVSWKLTDEKTGSNGSTDGNHLHMSAVEAALQLIHIFGNNGFVRRVELATTTVILECCRCSRLQFLLGVAIGRRGGIHDVKLSQAIRLKK
jgi:hypothetical protein